MFWYSIFVMIFEFTAAVECVQDCDETKTSVASFGGKVFVYEVSSDALCQYLSFVMYLRLYLNKYLNHALSTAVESYSVLFRIGFWNISNILHLFFGFSYILSLYFCCWNISSVREMNSKRSTIMNDQPGNNDKKYVFVDILYEMNTKWIPKIHSFLERAIF